MSLWRKRKSCDKLAPNVVANVHHNEQKPDHLVNILNNLSIQSKDLSMQSMWVDPPEGWRYGFPAIYDPASDDAWHLRTNPCWGMTADSCTV